MPALPNQTQMIFKDNTTLSQTNQNYRFFICPYMLLILLICNMANSSIQGYKRSLPYLRINIILILNTFLTQTFNAIVTSMVIIFAKGILIFFKHIFRNNSLNCFRVQRSLRVLSSHCPIGLLF